MEWKEHKCPNGATVRVWTEHDDVAQAAFTFYDEFKRDLAFVCPFCGNDDAWDNLTYERDGDQFNDTYTCDSCDTLITLITPYEAGEYHEVFPSETTYEIEFMWGGEPSTWPDRDEVSPDQPKLFNDE